MSRSPIVTALGESLPPRLADASRPAPLAPDAPLAALAGANLAERPLHLVLSGFMGAGKSTVGRLIAAQAGVPFVDLDDAVLAAATTLEGATPAAPREGTTLPARPLDAVAALFAELGEPTFRRLEAAALERALAAPAPSVIAAGGGALLDPASRERALRAARVVTLTAPAEVLLARAAAPGEPRRPLLEAPDKLAAVRRLLADRAAAYAEAHATIATEGGSIEQIAAAVKRAWGSPSLLVRLGARSYPVRFTGASKDGPGASTMSPDTSALSPDTSAPSRDSAAPSPDASARAPDAGAIVADVLAALRPSQWFLVTDSTVDALWGAPFLAAVTASGGASPAAIVRLTPGEREKHLGAVESVVTALIQAGADRDAVVVAHGGGVVSDIAGFAAAILLRGVRWISVPTTLLSMADAAIGGKTGVDVGLAKNAAGAFHQPSAVIIDVRRSATESERAFTGGLAEIAKAGAIADPALVTLLEKVAAGGGASLEESASAGGPPSLEKVAAGGGASLEESASAGGPPSLEQVAAGGGASLEESASAGGPPRPGLALLRSPTFLERAVALAAAVKTAIVALDERETGPRALLNFGHTLGHALEAAGGFARWTHGEAVSLGMVAALLVGQRLGVTAPGDAARLIALLEGLGLPVKLSRPDIDAALPYLSLDKKRRGRAVRAVFLTTIGRAETRTIPLDELARLFLDAAA